MAKTIANPFTPVVGKVPPHIAGREEIIADVEAALAGAGNDPAIISLLVGPRGTGKTALLSYFADTAESSGWVAARVTCVAGMLWRIRQIFYSIYFAKSERTSEHQRKERYCTGE